LTPPNKIRALANSLFGTDTRDLGNTVSTIYKFRGYENLIHDASNRLFETAWERVGEGRRHKGDNAGSFNTVA